MALCNLYFHFQINMTESGELIIYSILIPNYTLNMVDNKFLINSLSPICFTNKPKS